LQDEGADLLPELERLLAECARVLGRATFITVSAATLVTVLYDDAGRHDEAEQMLDDWHVEIIDVLGFDNELTQMVLIQRAQRQFGLDRLP
jgi:hypothetical protein